MGGDRDRPEAGSVRRMQDLLARTWSATSRFHVGDIAWAARDVPAGWERSSLRFWSVADHVVAWGWAEEPDHLELAVDPDHAGMVAEVIDWFDASGRAPRRSCTVMDGDTTTRAALVDRGYVEAPRAPYFVRHSHDLRRLPTADLPAGFRIESVTAADAVRRAEVHRAGWSDFGSTLSAGSYSRLMATYPYRPETDLVVAAPDGSWVASALGWFDDVNGVGLVEPVSTAPAYRCRGLGSAVNLALLKAFRDLGATSATVLPRGDSGYPAPSRLYRAIGYVPGSRTVTYVHETAET